jgi:hypothetical protein
MAWSFFNVKDFVTGNPLKVLSQLLDTDKHAAAKVIVDSAGAEVVGTKTDNKSAATDATAASLVALAKQCNFLLEQINAGSTAPGQKDAENSVPVVLPYDQAFHANATFTPAAALHEAGDVNGAAQQLAWVGEAPPSGSRFMIISSQLEIRDAAAVTTGWQLHFYSVTPPSALADGIAFNLAAGDRASYMGYIDLGIAADRGDTQWVETHGHNKPMKMAGTHVFAYLTNIAANTPAAVAHIPTIFAVAL